MYSSFQKPNSPPRDDTGVSLSLTCPYSNHDLLLLWLSSCSIHFPCSHSGLLWPRHRTAAREQILNAPARSCPMLLTAHSTAGGLI